MVRNTLFVLFAPKYLNTFIVISNTKYRFLNSNRFNSSLIFSCAKNRFSWVMMIYVYIQTDRKNTTDKNKILENKNKKFVQNFGTRLLLLTCENCFMCLSLEMMCFNSWLSEQFQFQMFWQKMHFFLASSQVDVASRKKYTCFEKKFTLYSYFALF